LLLLIAAPLMRSLDCGRHINQYQRQALASILCSGLQENKTKKGMDRGN
jgi:hypothetical protein